MKDYKKESVVFHIKQGQQKKNASRFYLFYPIIVIILKSKGEKFLNRIIEP